MRILKAISPLLAFLVATPVLAATVGFSDIADSPYMHAIESLAKQGVVQGYSDGTFRPNAPVNRAEFVKILLGTTHADMQPPQDLRCFSDLEVRVPQWYASPVCLARQLGVVSGYSDGTFRADQHINLAEALKITLRSFGVAVPAAHIRAQWYEPYLNAARDRQVLLPLLKTPNHIVTRGELAAMVTAMQESQGNEMQEDTATAVCGNGALEHGEQCDDGNTENSDGCSQLCIVVPEPVRLAMLQIDAQATGTISNVSRGKTGVSLLKFTAVSGRQDVLFTGAKFQASVGSLSYGQRYVLAMDTDGDGRYETTVSAGKAQGAELNFDIPGGIRVYQGIAVRMEVRADIVSMLGPVTLGLQFATGEPDYVHGIGAVDGIPLQGIQTDNACPNDVSVCFIRVNTRTSNDIAIQERGSLYVTMDSAPVRSQQVLGGAISGPLLRLQLRADGEDIDVKNLRFDGGTSSIDALLLFQVAPGTTIDTQKTQAFAQATTGQCSTQSSTRFCANLSLNMLRIGANQERTVVVAAKMKDEQSGAISGQPFALTLSAATDSTHAVDARGVASLSDLAQNDGNALANGEVFIGTAVPGSSSAITGPMHDTVLAKISGIANALQTDVVGIPSSRATIGGFQVSTSTHTNTFHGTNDVVLSSLHFVVQAQNVEIDPASYRLFNPENPAVWVSCSASQTTGSVSVQCNGIATSSIQYRIGQGQKATYMLEATITSSQLAPGDSSLNVSMSPLGQRGTTNAVSWSDDVTTLSWVDIEILRVQSTYFHAP